MFIGISEKKKGGIMKKFFLLVICLCFSLTGCCRFAIKDLNCKVDDLADRVEIIEKSNFNEQIPVKETVIEVATKDNYVPNTVDYSYKNSNIKMTKREIQMALKNAGYYFGNIDGKIGPKSRSAIKDFQRDNMLKVDGIVGRKTKRALVKYLEK